MKRLVKVILPPLIAFWTFALLMKLGPVAHHIGGLGNIGEGSIYGLISYYRIFGPLQMLIAILTQWLIFMPWWDKIITNPKTAVFIFISIVFICLIFASGIGYIIWDRTTGVKHLTDICLFMTAVQLFYWIIDFLLLYLIDWKAFKKVNLNAKKEKAPNL
jgi:hypothetical protein